MKERALIGLFRVPERDRAPLIAEGLQLLAEHVQVLAADAQMLWEAQRYRSAQVITHLADEQAGAALMLYDLVRVGAIAPDRRKTLRHRFYDHRARSLYVAAYDAALATLDEAQGFADLYRDDLLLDGPNDVDWIVRNELDYDREATLYVDLIDYGEGQDPDLRWHSPKDYCDAPVLGRFPFRTSAAVRVVLAMSSLGLLSTAGVETTRTVWNTLELEEHPRNLHWADAVDLNEQVLRDHTGSQRSHRSEDDLDKLGRYLIRHWVFPLTTLTMDKRQIKPAELRSVREDTLAREWFGGPPPAS